MFKPGDKIVKVKSLHPGEALSPKSEVGKVYTVGNGRWKTLHGPDCITLDGHSDGTYEDQYELVVNLSFAAIQTQPGQNYNRVSDKIIVEIGEIIKNKLKPTGCECGKEKHGFASHSNWCPKYV